MATITLTHDDLDHDVTNDVTSVTIAHDGTSVILDLGAANRARLTEFLSPFLLAGRAAHAATAGKVRAKATRKATAKTDLREASDSTAPTASDSTAPTASASSVTKLPVKNSTTKASRAEAAKENDLIRAWAKEQGIELNERGRIANEVKIAYGVGRATADTAISA